MVIELKKGKKIVMNSPEKVYKLIWGLLIEMQPFDRDKEHLFVIGVSRDYHVKYVDHVSMGTMHNTIAGPREIFRNAIHLGASAIFLAHNHPSGSVKPSRQDTEMTKTIVQAGRLLNIDVIDHVIVSNRKHYSFADEGQL